MSPSCLNQQLATLKYLPEKNYLAYPIEGDEMIKYRQTYEFLVESTFEIFCYYYETYYRSEKFSICSVFIFLNPVYFIEQKFINKL